MGGGFEKDGVEIDGLCISCQLLYRLVAMTLVLDQSGLLYTSILPRTQVAPSPDRKHSDPSNGMTLPSRSIDLKNGLFYSRFPPTTPVALCV